MSGEGGEKLGENMLKEVVVEDMSEVSLALTILDFSIANMQQDFQISTTDAIREECEVGTTSLYYLQQFLFQFCLS